MTPTATAPVILANPVRAGLVGKPEDWRFGGAVIPGDPKLPAPEPGFWEKFWKLYGRALHRDSGKIKRPPF